MRELAQICVKADCTLILAWRYDPKTQLGERLKKIKIKSVTKQGSVTFLMLISSPEEAGRYLETYKSYEKKPADALKEQVERDYLSKVRQIVVLD